MIQLVSYDAQIMSNGIFKSPVHRVVTNSERERISLAVFSSPDSDKEIEPIGRLFNDSRPRLYKKVKNYVDTYSNTTSRERDQLMQRDTRFCTFVSCGLY